MALRTLNDTISIAAALAALALVLPNDKTSGYTVPNTLLGTAAGSVLINDDTLLLSQQNTFPTLLIIQGKPDVLRVSWQTEQVKLPFTAAYLQQWVEGNGLTGGGAPKSMDNVWADMDLDIQRMKANLEDNPRLLVSGTRNAVSSLPVVLSPYNRMQNSVDKTTYPVPVLVRLMTGTLLLPAYVSAG